MIGLLLAIGLAANAKIEVPECEQVAQGQIDTHMKAGHTPLEMRNIPNGVMLTWIDEKTKVIYTDVFLAQAAGKMASGAFKHEGTCSNGGLPMDYFSASKPLPE